MLKISFLTAALLMTSGAYADSEFECEESALNYITSIFNTPYSEYPDSQLKAGDLKVISRRPEGDGAEAYEYYTVAVKDSNERFDLKLYIEGIGSPCPLVSYKAYYSK
jgi:hypothetical protein